MSIGATGKFPGGKLGPGDEGELRFAVGKDSQGLIHINFGKFIDWIAMPKENAIELAKTLLKHAGVKKIEIEF